MQQLNFKFTTTERSLIPINENSSSTTVKTIAATTSNITSATSFTSTSTASSFSSTSAESGCYSISIVTTHRLRTKIMSL